MAGIAVALTVVGWFLPHLGLIAALAVVPLGIVAHRYRMRALVASGFAALVLSFLVAGAGSWSNLLLCSAVGGLVGVGRRRGWGFARVLCGVLVIGPILGLVSVALLWVFSSLRKISLEQITNTWKGIKRILEALPGHDRFVAPLNNFVNAAVTHWWITVLVIAVVATFGFAVLGWVVLGAVLERLEWIRAMDRLDLEPDDTAPGPIPVSLKDVHYRYPETESEALRGVWMDVTAGELVALVGENGSGKSTLARILAGRSPTSGRVLRPGAAGLGRAEGTALIMQHPETQVLGVKVADDVVWGLPDDEGIDIESLLESVGLGGMSDRETSSLSGGELQRLAVAAALARKPGLLISDESTAMVDREGRQILTNLLAALPSRTGTAVVHVTHRLEEVAQADRVYRLGGGRIANVPANGGGHPLGRLAEARRGGSFRSNGNGAASGAPAANDGAPGRPPGLAGGGRRVEGFPARLEVVSVSHVYGVGTPWAQPALHDVNLTVEPGEGLLIVGDNGSGKSTLAWVLAGVLRPWKGECLLDGVPTRKTIGKVGLAFQHARLQLQRPTVLDDVKAAGAADDEAAAVALAAVGMDAAISGEVRVDTLSGGQQRRVALAGILGRRPSVLVLDEPLAGLDERTREGLVEVLSALRREHGLTLVVISHDLEGMERVCDRVIHLTGGRVVSDGSAVAAS
jgi:energy-coupling factor transport system ATP-binding protein